MIGQKTAAAIQRRYNTSYLVGPIAETICKFSVYLIGPNAIHSFLPIFPDADPAAGSSTDWAYDATKTNISFVFEFRDHRDGKWSNYEPLTRVWILTRSVYISFTGMYGFLLPANQIIPNSEEVIDGLKVLVAEAKKLNYFN